MPNKFHRDLRGKIEIRNKSKLSAKNLTLAYTPGVAEPCLAIAKNPEKIYDFTWKGNTILIVTDGSAVLGLGNIGPAAALPVMEGKSMLFKEFGDINCVPICIAESDPKKFCEIVEKIAPAYGGINLEDISAPRCFEIEERLKKRLKIPVFHDDQHGTAIVALAGLLNAAKVVNKKFESLKVVVNGAGSAGIAIAKLLKKADIKNLTLADSRGVCFIGRAGMNPQKNEVAKIFRTPKKSATLAETVIDADVLIGVSVAKAFTKKMITSMSDHAIVFALANPTPEILPKEAHTAGAAIVATGRSDFPNQINNVLAFPGIFRGALDSRCQITDKMKIAAAHAIANLVKKPTAKKIIPSALDKKVTGVVAKAVTN